MLLYPHHFLLSEEDAKKIVGKVKFVVRDYWDEVCEDALLTKVLEKFTTETPVTLTFRKAHFASGHDLKDFASKLGIELKPGDVEQ